MCFDKMKHAEELMKFWSDLANSMCVEQYSKYRRYDGSLNNGHHPPTQSKSGYSP